jgi:hypothetical protein
MRVVKPTVEDLDVLSMFVSKEQIKHLQENIDRVVIKTSEISDPGEDKTEVWFEGKLVATIPGY